jgi:hypothetical protein
MVPVPSHPAHHARGRRRRRDQHQFLASDCASHVTGEMLNVAGGAYMRN